MQSHFYKSILLSVAAAVLLNGCGGGAGFAQPDNAPVPISTSFTIGGSVTGLSETGLTLQNNGTDNLTLSANGSFTFATSVASGGNYAVTVLTQPGQQTCTVTQGAGTNIAANITNVAVSCSALNTYSISGNVTGLNAGEKITIKNNGSDPITIASNTAFTFATPISYGSSYAVTVHDQPDGQNCVVTNGATTHIAADVTNVAINCGPATYTVLYSFGINSTDAILPTNGNLVQASDGNFYGTTAIIGAYDGGTVFMITPQGIESILYSFNVSTPAPNSPFGAGLTIGSDGNFYGTTGEGGNDGCGTVFKLTPAGVLTVLYQFISSNGDGCDPSAGLTLGTDGNFYGTTMAGGANGTGTVFKISPTGSKSTIYSFGASGDGSYPQRSDLVQDSDGNFYGTTPSGGASGFGTVFKVTPAGVETVLHSFAGGSSDGEDPESSLSMGADGNFYGTTTQGGTNNDGVVFKITPGGAETIIHAFAGGTADGAQPTGSSLVLGTDGYFYSMTSAGGTSGNGTLYRITPAGAVTILHSFAGGTADGSAPQTGVTIGTDGYVYGTTYTHGAHNGGVFFRY